MTTPFDQLDPRNIKDRFKGLETAEIKERLREHHQGFSVCMTQMVGDFNISSVIRSANAFGAERVYYVGRRRYDKRGTVGTYHYTDVVHCKDYDDFLDTIPTQSSLVALENNTAYETSDLRTFDWPINPIIILGEEGYGLTDEILSQVDNIVTIPDWGSVRSINAACAASITFYDYTFKRSLTHNDEQQSTTSG